MEFAVWKEFNGMILKCFREQGYKFLRYEKFDEGISMLTPLFNDDQVPADNGYTIPIDDDQCDEMARGVNEQEFYVL
jgi:hypothetical protein